jgi:hypothetical protein
MFYGNTLRQLELQGTINDSSEEAQYKFSIVTRQGRENCKVPLITDGLDYGNNKPINQTKSIENIKTHCYINFPRISDFNNREIVSCKEFATETLYGSLNCKVLLMTAQETQHNFIIVTRQGRKNCKVPLITDGLLEYDNSKPGNQTTSIENIKTHC